MSIKKLESSPMGWNSFDCYGPTVYEEDVKANIDYMAEHLLQHGYDHIVVDIGWFSNYDLLEGEKYPVIRPEVEHWKSLTLDEDGILDSSAQFFPSGVDAIAEYAHSKGLKFGVHLMRGIPRLAVERKIKIKGTPYTTDQIADKASICKWCNHNYGVDMSKVGAQEYYDLLIAKMARWKIDFIKYDDITGHPKEVEAVVRAMEKVAYPMVLSLSPGGDTIPANMPTYEKATCLRVTKDVWDNDASTHNAFIGLEKYYMYAKQGFFIDLDMICIGHLRLNMPAQLVNEYMGKNEAFGGQGQERYTRLSEAQQRSFMTIRAISASPLIIGSDLPTIDAFAFSLITNQEMIRCNQTTVQCHPFQLGALLGWKSDAGYLAIFNQDEDVVKVTMEQLNLTQSVYDIWADKTYAITDEVIVEKNDVLFLKV